MVTTLNNRPAARDALAQEIQYVCGRVVMSGTADVPNGWSSQGARIGTIPAGSVIVGVCSRVVTAVAGGTPVLGVGVCNAGTTPSSIVGTNGNLQNVMAEAAGSETVVPLAALTMPFTVDQDVYVGTTGGVTSGDVIVAVQFIKPLN